MMFFNKKKKVPWLKKRLKNTVLREVEPQAVGY